MSKETLTFWRKVFCWAGLIFMLTTLLPAWGYDVPPEVECGPDPYDPYNCEFTGRDDFSQVPWWVRMWKEFTILTFIATGLLLWGALKKSPEPDLCAVFPYMGNSKTKIYHWRTCQQALKINPNNAVMFQSPTEASLAGFHPCKKCDPKPTRRLRQRGNPEGK